MSFAAVSIFLTALGWALVNSFWQFAICWLVYRTLSAGIPKLTAASRHSMALILLLIGTIFFIANLAHQYFSGAAAYNPLPIAVIADALPVNAWHSAGLRLNGWMPWCSLLYMLCVALLFIKLHFFVQRATRLQKNGITKMKGVWGCYIRGIAAQLGIQKEVKALLSVYVDTPQVIGFIKPVILLPASCLTNLTTAQLEAVLLHELVHIKRNDYLVNLFVASVEILFFFNPFVKQLAAAIRQEREYDCDDVVLQFQHPPHHYATALLTLEKSRLLPVTYGIAASGKNQQQLLIRIQRIMGIQNKETGAFRLAACLLVILFLGFMTTVKPGKMTIDKYGTPGLSLAANNLTRLQYNDEAAAKIAQESHPAASGKMTIPALEKVSTALHAFPIQPEFSIVQPSMTMIEEEAPADDGTIQIAANRENIDFSLQQNEAVDAAGAEEAAEALITAPYVPANSFSYQYFQDTSSPKAKGETFNERSAKEALIKARKALEQIDWQKIEKQLKYNSQDMAKLKKELEAQIQSLNWQKISRDVQSELTQDRLNKLQQAVQLDQTVQQYRQAESYYEALQKQMAEQEQALKASQERMLESQQAAENQRKKLLQEMKRRRIIYI